MSPLDAILLRRADEQVEADHLQAIAEARTKQAHATGRCPCGRPTFAGATLCGKCLQRLRDSSRPRLEVRRKAYAAAACVRTSLVELALSRRWGITRLDVEAQLGITRRAADKALSRARLGGWLRRLEPGRYGPGEKAARPAGGARD